MNNENINNVAFICENEMIYRDDLDKKSNSLANYIYKKNVSKVLIYGHKNSYMLISILACLKAGVTYIICDVNLPKLRIDNILNVYNANLAICTENILISSVECISGKEIDIITSCEAEKTKYRYDQNETAYVVFTSGSTGIPKGIEVTYGNLENFLNWFSNLDVIKCEKPKIILNQALFSFDLSVADIFYSLYSKAALYCLTKNIIDDFSLLFYHLKNSNAQMLIFTPSFIELCLCDKTFDENLMPNLKIIFLCGEVLKPIAAKKLIERFRKVKIINAYGPSEATCCVSAIEITKEMTDFNKLPIGLIDNGAVEIRIYDENGIEIKDNSIGEIVLIGKSIAKGYCNYKNKSFGSINGEMSYFTGDRGHIEGNILFFDGGIDKQIKYKGYRVETQDIENNICKISGVNQALVFSEKSSNNEVLSLSAQIVCDNDIDVGYVKRNLKLLLPEYMIPKSIKIVDSIPLGFNSKAVN